MKVPMGFASAGGRTWREWTTNAPVKHLGQNHLMDLDAKLRALGFTWFQTHDEKNHYIRLHRNRAIVANIALPYGFYKDPKEIERYNKWLLMVFELIRESKAVNEVEEALMRAHI